MKNLSLKILTASVMFMTVDCLAINFVTENQQENLWENKGSKTLCVLKQNVKNWGDVEFSLPSGKIKQLEIFMHPMKPFSVATDMIVRSEAPYWKPGIRDRDIATVGVYRYFDGYVSGNNAWYVLSALEKGMSVAFLYRDNTYYDNEEIKVSLNPFNFASAYSEFMNCTTKLLPFSYDDIKYSVIHFKNKSEELTNYSYTRLSEIAEYLVDDDDLQELSITVHTDSIGEDEPNKELTDRQANVVKRFFMEKGIKPNKIVVNSFGESDLAASNTTDKNQKVNRRVLIEIKNAF